MQVDGAPTRQVLELGAGEQGVEGVAKLVEQRLHLCGERRQESLIFFISCFLLYLLFSLSVIFYQK